MAKKAVVDAVYARLGPVAAEERHWTDSLDVEVLVYDKNLNGEVPIDGTPFIAVQFPISNTKRWPLGKRTYIEEGAIRLVINVDKGSGTETADRWGDELADLFRDVTFSGVKCQVPSSPVTHDENDRGSYFQISVIAPYTFQFEDS